MISAGILTPNVRNFHYSREMQSVWLSGNFHPNRKHKSSFWREPTRRQEAVGDLSHHMARQGSDRHAPKILLYVIEPQASYHRV